MIEKLKAKLTGDINLKEILTGSAITFILKMSGMLLGYIVMLIISRKYGAEGIGVYNLTLSIMMFVAMISAMGMNVSILRYVGQFNNNKDEYKLKLLYRNVIELTLPLSIFLAFILYLYAGFITENILHNQVYKPAVEFAATVVPFMLLLNVNVEFIRGLKKLKVSEFLRSVSRPLVNIFLLLIFGLFINDQLLPLYTLGVAIAISGIYAFYLIVKKLKKIVSEVKDDFSKKELLITSLPMMVSSVASFITANISIFMLEAYSSTEDVGIYSVAIKIATAISLILVVVNTISAPKFSELYWAGRYDDLQKVITYSTKLTLISSFILAFVILFFSEQLLGLFGKEFLFAKNILFLLIIWQIINSASGPVGILLNMTGYQKILRNFIIFSMLLGVSLNYFLVPTYGLLGAASATIISGSLFNILCVVYVKIKLGFITFYIPYIFGDKR